MLTEQIKVGRFWFRIGTEEHLSCEDVFSCPLSWFSIKKKLPEEQKTYIFNVNRKAVVPFLAVVRYNIPAAEVLEKILLYEMQHMNQ